MLPIIQDESRGLMLMQTRWASEINPLLRKQILQGVMLKNIPLIMGATVIDHRLSRRQQGWLLTDIDGGAIVYRSEPFNEKTLTLTASAACNVSLWVF